MQSDAIHKRRVKFVCSPQCGLATPTTYQKQGVHGQWGQLATRDGRNGAQREGGDNGKGQCGRWGAKHRRKLQSRQY